MDGRNCQDKYRSGRNNEASSPGIPKKNSQNDIGYSRHLWWTFQKKAVRRILTKNLNQKRPLLLAMKYKEHIEDFYLLGITSRLKITNRQNS